MQVKLLSLYHSSSEPKHMQDTAQITVSLRTVITTYFSGRIRSLNSRLSYVQDSRLKLMDHTFSALCGWCCCVDFIKPGTSNVHCGGLQSVSDKNQHLQVWDDGSQLGKNSFAFFELVKSPCLNWKGLSFRATHSSLRESCESVRLTGKEAQCLQWCCRCIDLS